jgi:MscS family membrane protein
MDTFFNDFYNLNISTGILWWALGAIVLTLLVKRFLSKYIARLFVKLLRKTGRRIDEPVFYQLLVAPLEAFLVWFIILLSLEKIRLPNAVKDYMVYHNVTLGNILQALSATLLIILFTWLLLRAIDFIADILKKRANLTEGQGDDQLIVFFKDFFKVILVIIGILLVLRFALGYNISNLVTGLGIMGAAIALATKESLENLIASFIIFFDKPFTTGDILKVHDVSGTVERIGLRSTRIRTDAKTYVTVPNKQMVDSIVDNHSLRTQRKAGVVLQIDTGTSPQKLQQFIAHIDQLLNGTPLVESHSVMLNDIVKDAFVVPVDYFTAPVDPQEFNHLKNDLNFKLLELLEKDGVSLSGERQELSVQRG